MANVLNGECGQEYAYTATMGQMSNANYRKLIRRLAFINGFLVTLFALSL